MHIHLLVDGLWCFNGETSYRVDGSRLPLGRHIGHDEKFDGAVSFEQVAV